MSTLKERWQEQAFAKRDKKQDEIFWADYLRQEQKIYEHILGEKITVLNGKLSELANKYKITNEFFCGFLDGISGALKETIDLENISEDTEINITIDYEKLYKEMVNYKAEHLYNLKEWNDIFDEATKKKFYLDQKKSKTIINDKKIERNSPCPCGSGKKYKKCCGFND